MTRPVCGCGLGFQFGDPGQQRLQADTHQVRHHRVVLAARAARPLAADDLPGTDDH